MKSSLTLGFVSIFFLSSFACATSVKSKTQLGGGGYDESLTGEGDFIDGSHEEGTKDWSWNLLVEFSQTPGTDSVGNAIIDHTYNFTPETGFETGGGVGTVWSYTYSYTPEESLVSTGPEIDIYYDFDLTDEKRPKTVSKDKSADNFIPSMKIKAGGKEQLYTQTFTGSTAPTKKNAARPTTGFNNLRQIASVGEITIIPAKLLSFDFTFNYYFYDRNVADFLSYINSPSAARFGTGGFSSSITNFSQSTMDGTLTLFPIDHWSLESEVINSTSAVDLSAGWSYQYTLFRELGDWKAGVGYEYDSSSLSGTNEYGIFILSCEL